MPLDPKTLQRLNAIGIALSREHRTAHLLEKILEGAKELTRADGGTIYTIKGQGIHFEITMSTSMGFHMGGTSGVPAPFHDLPLFLPDGSPNDGLIAAFAVNYKQTVNIPDVYHAPGFDFSGTRDFDDKTGYHTKAVLTIPIKNHEDRVIALLQLINPEGEAGFTEEDVELASSLASQASVALTSHLLIATLRTLFESLIRVIAEAIDEKSPSTGNHSKRVPVIATMLAEAVNDTTDGVFKEVHFSPLQIDELKVAALLHDCGKITTPVHIMEKSTKLQTLFDRIELVDVRFLALREKTEKEALKRKLEWFESHYPKEYASASGEFIHFDKQLWDKLEEYEKDLAFLHTINSTHDNLTEESKRRLEHIALIPLSPHEPMLSPDELENLSIPSGNLTEKERSIIQHHVVMTYRMLSQLDFPRELSLVPEIASSHHERVDGKGYPRGLTKDQLLLQSRILTLADVFESLSAPDRPYRAPLPLSQALQEMQKMVDDGRLDPDLYALFLQKKVYLPYAHHYLSPDQIDVT